MKLIHGLKSTFIITVGVFLSGCDSYERLLHGRDSSAVPAPCSGFTQDLSGGDVEVMDQLTFDQRVQLDSASPYFDGRQTTIDSVLALYSGAAPYPATGNYLCLSESEFKRVVDASVALGRFPEAP